MEFTNDIRFNKKPKASKLLKITYSGTLYKNNSQEVSIVYGFGENWEKTTEHKMNKNARGFSYNILMENYNTFNFCFKNENNEWDNNNSFNYITPIQVPAITSPVNSVSSQEANSIVSENIDNLINNLDINLENANSEKTITTTSDSSLLDTLIQELFEEYSNQVQSATDIQTPVNVVEAEVKEETQNVSTIESEIDKYFENSENVETPSKIDSYNELSVLFDELIEETQEKTKTINIGKELNQMFDEIFDENFQPSNNTTETYIPQADNSDTKIEEAVVENSEENTTVSTTPTVEENQNFFNFDNLDFDFSIPKAEVATHKFSSNKFSDSFYDDEDLSTHELNYEFQEIIDNVMDSLSQETEPAVIEANNEDYQAQSEAFDKAVSEYADYFDNLIEEIVMSPVTSLSSSVSNEQVFESEQTNLAVIQNENTAVANTTVDTSTDGVANEYALYDYRNHSFFYMMKRRVKLIFNSLFTKIPKIFGKETDTNNN